MSLLPSPLTNRVATALRLSLKAPLCALASVCLALNADEPAAKLQILAADSAAPNQMEAQVLARVFLKAPALGGKLAMIQIEARELAYDHSLAASPVAVAKPTELKLAANGAGEAIASLVIGTPMMWTPQTPYLYAINVTAFVEGKAVASADQAFALRSREFSQAKLDLPNSPLPKTKAPTQHLISLPTLWVLSDSTANSNWKNQLGWGDPLARFFDPAKINVLNRARAGRSSRTFIREGLWERVRDELRAGDFVIIQFGHNDPQPLDQGRARGSLPGSGDDTQTVILPNGASETVHSFGWYLRTLASEARTRGAHPIFLSITARNTWKEGHHEIGDTRHAEWTESVARSLKLPFIALTPLISERYEKLGHAAVQRLFCSPEDTTHASPDGARLNASLVVAELRNLPNAPLDPFLSPDGQAIAAASSPRASSSN